MKRSGERAPIAVMPAGLPALLAPLLCCVGIQMGWCLVLMGLERVAQPQPSPPALVLSSLRT